MGILRTDRVSGLGGANAIKGSVSFNNNAGDYKGGYLKVNLDSSNRSNFDFDGDFTIECWVFKSKSTVSGEYDGLLYISDDWRFKWQQSNKIMYYDNGTDAQFMNYNTNEGFLDNNWHHLAIVRSSNTITGYVDGTSYGTASESGDFDPGSNTELLIGYNVHGFGGFISNLRVVKGTAVYTGNFTPPTSELTAIDGTVLLCCQSPGDPTQEATGNYVVESVLYSGVTVDSKPPSSSHFTPNSPVGFSTTSDVGSQYGSTFDGVTTFDSQAYFVPPGGNTRERNRGRGLSMAGSTPSISNVITFIEMSSHGQTGDFGDLTQIINGSPGACSSSTRGIVGGGQSPSSNLNAIEFVTISNTANAQDFADLSVARRGIAACGNDTRGLWGGGRSDPSGSNPDDTIDFVTIATLGDATDFGNLSVARRYLGSTSSTTRGFWMGGNSPSASDVIDFITIASQGTNADDFGNLTAARSSCEACSSATRAIVIGGFISPAYVDTIDFFTMASSGDAIDFGDSTTVSGDSSPCSNSIRGYRVGGGNDSTQMNSIDFVTIATTGNAQDFGDLPVVQSEGGGCSDSHGGLE